jgi:hypothetical protein
MGWAGRSGERQLDEAVSITQRGDWYIVTCLSRI